MSSRPPLALCYHGIDDVPLRRDHGRLFVRPADLERQIRLLGRWGYRLVTFGELAKRASEGAAQGLAALTFDDGLVDNLVTLVPLLASAGVPATLFVVSGWLGQPHPVAPWTRVMTEDELRAAARAGLEIGGHSTSHDHLPDLDEAAAEEDMRRCRTELEAALDRPVSAFAYPYGDATGQTMAACAAAGYLAACRCGGIGSWDEPFNLPRQDVKNRSSMLGFWLKRDGRYRPLVRSRPVMALRQLSGSAPSGHR